MKKKIFILSLFFAGIFVSNAQEFCDTLKLKVIKSYYAISNDGVNLKMIDELDGVVINIDTLSIFYLAADIVNVSNDTFSATDAFSFGAICTAYTDTGAIADNWGSMGYNFGKEFFPNDTMRTGIHIKFDFLAFINWIKENADTDFERINYYKMVIKIGYTNKDGYYTDSVCNASADTSTFRIVRGNVGLQEKEDNSCVVSIFPNPACLHFTVSNTADASLQLYNILGQEVLHTYGREENTVINLTTLPQGVYVLKVVKEGGFTHKIVIKK